MKRTILAISFIVIFLTASCLIDITPVLASENSWTTKQPMPTARSELGVAVVNGKIYAIGGSRGIIVGYDNNEEYDPAKDTWIAKKLMPTPRGGFAIAVFQNKIYVIGGAIRAGTGFTEMTLVNEVYDPATDTWSTKASMPMLKESLSANVVNGKIYLIGGMTQSEPNATVHPSTDNLVYDPITDSWTTKTPIPTRAYSYASAVVDNRIYVISGHETEVMSDNGTTHIPAPNQIYDPQTDTWSNGASMPIAVDFGAAAGATTGVAAPKAIYVMGGFVGFVSPLNLTQVYHPENDTWSIGASMQIPLYGLGVAIVNDTLFAIGGKTGIYSPDVAENNQYTPIGYGAVPHQLEPFPTTFIAVASGVSVAIIGIGLFLYLNKRGRSWQP